jgi:hypothetical protein
MGCGSGALGGQTPVDLSPHSTGCALTACSQTGFADWLPEATRLGPGDRDCSLGSFWFFVGWPLRHRWCASCALQKRQAQHGNNLLIGIVWLHLADADCDLCVGRVESKANIADGPTRDYLFDLEALGAVFVSPSLPEWIQDVWNPMP